MKLKDFGWSSFFKKQLKQLDIPDGFVGRITNAQKSLYLLISETGEIRAKVCGGFIHRAQMRNDYPVVGDWVVFTKHPEDDVAMIQAVLTRRNSISRSASGGSAGEFQGSVEEQIIAANIDTVFIVTGLDRDFNLRRIERYLTLVYSSGATPIIILNKMDLCEDPEKYRYEVQMIAIGVSVHMVSAHNAEDVDLLRGYLYEGQTITLLGSSGVGKSTLTNSLLGTERQKVQSISVSVGKGVHTTTSRELIALPDGGMLIDTPGMRELQLYDDASGLDVTFEDIELLAEQCRFSDCRHENEPGCKVLTALEDGTLDQGRFQNYIKLKKELHYVSERQVKSARTIEQEKWKDIKKRIRRMQSPKH